MVRVATEAPSSCVVWVSIGTTHIVVSCLAIGRGRNFQLEDVVQAAFAGDLCCDACLAGYSRLRGGPPRARLDVTPGVVHCVRSDFVDPHQPVAVVVDLDTSGYRRSRQKRTDEDDEGSRVLHCGWIGPALGVCKEAVETE